MLLMSLQLRSAGWSGRHTTAAQPLIEHLGLLHANLLVDGDNVTSTFAILLFTSIWNPPIVFHDVHVFIT